MKNVLDLSVFTAITLDIKLPDGRLLKLTKPTQRLVIKLMALKSLDASDSKAIMTALDDMALDILNSNDTGTVFDMVFVNTLNTAMKSALVQAYSEFIMQVQSNPNS